MRPCILKKCFVTGQVSECVRQLHTTTLGGSDGWDMPGNRTGTDSLGPQTLNLKNTGLSSIQQTDFGFPDR